MCRSRISSCPWLLWLKFLRDPPPAPCMVGGPSLSLRSRSLEPRVFFAGQLSSSDPGQGRALELRCACSETAEVSAQFTFEQDMPRVWWCATLGTLLFALAGGLLCWSRQRGPGGSDSRPDPSRPSYVRLTHLLRNSIRRVLKEATQEQLTNESPSATVGSPRLCELRILGATESSCGPRRVPSRWLFFLERRRLGGALFRTRLLRWRQRRLCYREPAGADGRLVGPPRAARGDTCGAHGLRRRRTPPLATSAARCLSGPARAILSLRRSHHAFRWKESKLKEGGLESGSEAIHAQGSSTRLSQLETPEKGAFASTSAQLGLSQKSRGPDSRSSIAGGLTVPSVLGRSGPPLSGPAACARARVLLGGGADPRATKLRMHDQVSATHVGLQTAQPDPPNEAATLGSVLLRIEAHWCRSTILVGQFTTLLD